MLRVYPNLHELAAVFDYFVLDVWGVLHDGEAPYPEAIAGLAALKRCGKRVLLLSNTPSTALVLREELSALGFPPDTYEEILTSGQVTREMIGKQENQGQSYYYIGPPEQSCLLAGLGYRSKTRLEEVGFLLVTGLNDRTPRCGRLPRITSPGLATAFADVLRQSRLGHFPAGRLDYSLCGPPGPGL